MQLDAQTFLRLTMASGTLVTWDIEASGLNGDYNSIICVSCKPYGKRPITFKIDELGNDRKVVREAKAFLEAADGWVTYYGKGFDVKMLNTRLLRWNIPPVEPRPHVDMFFQMKYKLNTSRKSQAHILRFLNTPESKMDVAPDTWAELAYRFKPNLRKMVARCESDTCGLEALFTRTHHVIQNITR